MEWDQSQLDVIEACEGDGRFMLVGAGGTGKTSVLHEVVARRVARGQRVAVMTPDRRSASDLRNSMARVLGGMGDNVTVQTLVSFALSIVSAHAQAVGRAVPVLISGPDEDVIIGDILTDPDSGIEFPQFVTAELLESAGFRLEMRNLMTRAGELGLGPSDLSALAVEHNEPMWKAAAQALDLYEGILSSRDAFAGSSSAPDRLDHSHLVRTAVSLLEEWDTLVGPTGVARPRWDVVIVDDVQDAPRSLVKLLEQVARDGATVIATGNPDAAVQGFRGGLASMPQELINHGFSEISMTVVHRHGSNIASLVRSVDSLISVPSTALHRKAQPKDPGGEVRVLSFAHPEEEAAGIARVLREVHRRGVPYGDMAVVTRSRNLHPGLRASLVRREIPVGRIRSVVPLREEPAVAALLDLILLSLGGKDTSTENVLTGPLLAVPPLRVQQILRLLRGIEAVNGGVRSDERLLQAYAVGVEEIPEGAPELRKLADIVAAIRRADRASSHQVEAVLWAAWDSAGKAEEWRTVAMGAGLDADAADSYLDSVIQLFRAAQRMADLDSDSSITQFIADIEAQSIPEDSIARRGAARDSVTLTTPNASMGREWGVVVVASLNDGLWPNIRLRDSLTHTSKLAAVVTNRYVQLQDPTEDRRAQVRDVVDDELRQFEHAISRARDEVVLTCVQSADTRESRFFGALGLEPTPLRASADTLDPAQIVAALRAADTPRSRELITSMEQAGVAQANAGRWCDALEWTEGKLEDSSVSISPSKVEMLEKCPLRGVLAILGVDDTGSTPSASLGTLIHKLAEEFCDRSPEGIVDAFDREWPTIAPVDDAVTERQMYQHGVAAVEQLRMYLEARSSVGRVEAERGVYVQVDEFTVVKGTIDRIERYDDGATIVDFKTGSMITKAEAESNVQLALYQYALNDPTVLGAQLVYLAHAQAKGPAIRPQSRLTEERRRELVNNLRLDAANMRAEQVPVTPSDEVCRTCPFTTLCPVQAEGRLFS